MLCVMHFFSSEVGMRQKGRMRFLGSWNLPKRSCQMPGPMFKHQMVDRAVSAINIYALSVSYGYCPQASGAGDVGCGTVCPASTSIFEKIRVPSKA